jgi:hypothetical protein
VAQRVGAILRNGGKLLGVGFGASMLGKFSGLLAASSLKLEV